MSARGPQSDARPRRQGGVGSAAMRASRRGSLGRLPGAGAGQRQRRALMRRIESCSPLASRLAPDDGDAAR